MSDTLRQDIIFKILKIASDNSDLSLDEQLKLSELSTQAMFAQLMDEGASSSESDPDRERNRTKKRMKKKDRDQRKEHVGRFFLQNLIWKDIRKLDLPDCLLPVFAKSVHNTIGEENYEQISGKINRLLEFGEKKGFDYDKIMDSKPGKTIAEEILTLYKNEMGSSNFEKQLKNSLDETLVKNISNIESDSELDIEETVSKAYNEFKKLVTSKT
jgi:hypothetical protein|tara:strand:- start:546 stop:1187 length:642 start_codon:yes stop_codon:yes gene_type:complete